MTNIGSIAYVTSRTAQAVYAVDTANGNSVTVIPVGGTPQYIVAVGTKLYISHLTGNNVSVIDTANGNSVSTVTLPATAAKMVVLNNDIYLAGGTSAVSIIHTAYNDAVTSAGTVLLPRGITSLGGKVYAMNIVRTIYIIDPADIANPTVAMVSPANGATVSGPAVTLAATSSDDDVIVGVQFLIDGVNLGSEVNSTTSTSTINWDATLVPNGVHTISAVARDPAGKYSTSTISVTVNNIAAVSLTSPTPNSIVSGSVNIAADATSSLSTIAGVQFLIDNVPFGSEDIASPYATSWNSAASAEGSHTITAVARDLLGNYATSSMNVSSNNSVYVALTGPNPLFTQFRSALTLFATSSDVVGVLGVQFKINGVNVGVEDTASPYSTTWSTSGLPDGTYTLTATARTAAGFTSTASQQIVLDKTNNIEVGTSGGPEKLLESNGLIYVLGTSALGKVFILNPATSAITMIATSTGGLSSVDFLLLNSKLFVSNSQDHNVGIIDLANSNSLSTINVGTTPYNMIAFGSKVYVANVASNNVSIIDTANGNSVTTKSVGTSPRNFAIMGTKIFLTNSNSTFVSVIDTANNDTVSSIAVGATSDHILVMGTKVYVSHNTGTISIIDTANGNSVTNIGMGGGANSLVAVGTKIYMSDYTAGAIKSIDTANNNATSSVAVGQAPGQLLSMGTKLYAINSYITHLVDFFVLDTTDNSTTTFDLPAGGWPEHMLGFGTKLFAAAGTSGYIHVLETASVVAASSSDAIVQSTDSVAPGSRTATFFQQMPRDDSHRLLETQALVMPVRIYFAYNLFANMRSSVVLELQRFLNRSMDTQVARSGAGSIGKETTFFGPATRQAVQKFQLKYGIVKSGKDPGFGVVGPKTRAKIHELLLLPAF